MIDLGSTLSRLRAKFSGLYIAFLGQSLSRARLNAANAYDQSNDLFEAFLSKEMMYSCALWSDEEGGLRGDLLPTAQPSDLETAQLRKIHHVLTRARVKPGMRVLEFGSGWGGVAIEVSASRTSHESCADGSLGRPFIWCRGRYPDVIHRAESSSRGED